ncbi:MAG: hypothetical protein LBE56_12415 [Tannerella sp.]|jgi:hypothetical protein|nr:hypothetical protein [Tannerella sp.]
MKRFLIVGGIILALVGAVTWQYDLLKKARQERDTYRNNTAVLLQDVSAYRTKDSLNAVSVGNLEFKLSEMEKYRAGDLKLIETLKVDRKRLESITTAQTQTIYELRGNLSPVPSPQGEGESPVPPESAIRDTLRCVSIRDKWFEMSGCITPDSRFEGWFLSRDSLLYVEHIIPKRFLFIKWGVKERRQEIVSRNPNTVILGAEFITIRR